MVLLHHRIAEGGLDAPQAEDDARLDPVILLDAGQQRGILLGLLLALSDAPVGDAAVEVLPDLLVESGWLRICSNTRVSGLIEPMTRS